MKQLFRMPSGMGGVFEVTVEQERGGLALVRVHDAHQRQYFDGKPLVYRHDLLEPTGRWVDEGRPS